MAQRDNRSGVVGKLPLQLTSFVGRSHELTEIAELLTNSDCRMLTLYGPGGMGKTRLALQAGVKVQAHFRNGVCFVPLQSVQSIDFLVPAVADVLELPLSGQKAAAAQLLDYLQDQEMLLILDNFEQLLVSPEEATGLLAEILQTAPGVTLLITSQEVLNVQEEWLYPVQGMTFPTFPPTLPQERALADWQEYSAIQLFAERARRVRRDFSLTEELAGVVRICQLVEGAPLALELAAAWTKTLSCETIAGEIERNLNFLTTNLRNIPERQRSMRVVFERAWQLLSPSEQDVFKRLSVFRGSFHREMAERIAGASLPALSALVDKSLLRTGSDNCYQNHELLRQYAAEQLIQSPEDVAWIYDLHCTYYTDFLHEQLTDILGGQQVEAMTRIEAELENIRAAWQWAVELNKIEAIQNAAQVLVMFYQFQSRFAEGVNVFEKAVARLDMAEPAGQQGLILAELLVELGWLYMRVGQLENAERVSERSRQIFLKLNVSPPSGMGLDPLVPLALLAVIRGDYNKAVELGEQARQANEARADKQNLAVSKYVLAGVALARGVYEAAYSYAQQAYAVASAANNRWFMAYCLNELGNAACALNELAAAKGYYEASYAIRKAFDDPEGMAVALNRLGKIALSQQNYPEAKTLYQQSLAIYLKINDKGGLATSLTGLGSVARPTGEHDAARRYFQEALQIAADMAYTPLILSILVGVGDLLLHLGRQKRGVELLALACHHPASDRETKDRACRLLGQRQAEIPADVLAVATQNGKSADLANWVTRVQVELAMPVEFELSKKEAAAVGSTAAASLHPVNAALVEPLTLRELEVLQLIAEGKTNQQMAEALVISVGTAKWYTSQIYGKLNVSSRTQAVARARELALLA